MTAAQPATPGSDSVHDRKKHHPNLMSAGRHGSWCSCPCGWTSGTYGTVVGAHLAFGRHLVTAAYRTNPSSEETKP